MFVVSQRRVFGENLSCREITDSIPTPLLDSATISVYTLFFLSHIHDCVRREAQGTTSFSLFQFMLLLYATILDDLAVYIHLSDYLSSQVVSSTFLV